MCKHTSAIILIVVSLLLIILSILYLHFLFIPDYTSPSSSILASSSSTSSHQPSTSGHRSVASQNDLCTLGRLRCLENNGCRVALNYLETFCLFSDPQVQCTKHCRTMVTCIAVNPAAKGLLNCGCSSAINQASNSLIKPDCLSNVPGQYWCRPEYTLSNLNACRNLDNCDPIDFLCGPRTHLPGCEHIDLGDSFDHCRQLFTSNKCSSICKFTTRLAWIDRLQGLMECVCSRYNSACELEKQLIIGRCLNRRSSSPSTVPAPIITITTTSTISTTDYKKNP